ncbi:WD40-repeat-containing domain protein [Naematelia encephala]|uniref:WD40-repeat-containing domain protein n=1 Tax=Naematelia encephala TaxID=71784 RepID=A0A1Y2BFQ0_9TREE|nr:WD40-repeat-containing domain protein [Naematelia encephala]
MSLPNLIAHYLATNYPSVLDAFVQAAHIAPPDVTQPPNPDLRTLLSDWQSQQVTERLEAVTIDENAEGWQKWKLRDFTKIAMSPEEKLLGAKRTLEGITAANLLTVQVQHVPKRVFDLASASYIASRPLSILTSSVDKTLRIIDYESGEVDRIIEPHRAAILSFALHPTNPRYLVTGSMDGTTVLTDLITSQTLQTWKSGKFVVRVAFSPDGRFLATASYDRNVVVYEALATAEPDIPLDETDDAALACEPDLRYEEKHRIKVDSNPEAILFHPMSEWLMYTLRESHQLYYVHLGSWQVRTKSFNPHPFDTHVSFSVLNMALHPSGRIVACQTGDHRGGSGERILLYGIEPDETERLACVWTGHEGDDFVLPRMAWLPDGSGFITTTPNGYLHLITVTGETRSSIKIHGAEYGATSEVVRDCSVATVEGGWEVVSVGYDRRVRISR